MRQYQAILPREGVTPHTNWKLYLALVVGGLVLGKVMAMGQRGAVGTPEFRLIGIISAQIALFILSLFNEKFAYFALIIYMPFSGRFPGDYGFAVNIANILILIVLFGLLVRSIKTGEVFFEKSSLDKLLLLWLIFISFSFMRGAYLADRNWTILAVLMKRYLTPLMLYLLTFWLIRDRDYLKDALVILLLGVALTAFLNVKDAYIPTEFHWDVRWGSVVSQGNLMAAFMSYSMFIFIGIFFQNAGKPLYWGLLIPFYWCMRAIMLSFSRGGWIAFVAGSIAFAFLKNKFLGAIVLILFLAIYNFPYTFLPGSVAMRIESTTTTRRHGFETKVKLEGTAASRMVIWKGAIKMIAANPIMGVGYTWAPKLISHYAPVPYLVDLHNGYLTIATEMGLPALIVFFILIHHIFKTTWIVYRRCPDPLMRAVAHGYLAGVVGFIAANMFGDRFSFEETVCYFWVMAAIMMKVKTAMDKDGLPVPIRQGNAS